MEISSESHSAKPTFRLAKEKIASSRRGMVDTTIAERTALIRC